MKILIKILILSTVLFVSGCGNFNSVYRTFNVDDGDGAMVDIKQRAIVVSKNNPHKRTIVCSEPSPDALSAYAAELAAEADVPGAATVRLASAFQEGSSYVGLRTQSIQLLRDSLYRLCEGYMSGALDDAQYDILMRRYQKYMVALLGIEQLTGTFRVPPVAISTQGVAEVARSISELRLENESIDTKIKELEQKKTVDGVTDEQKTEIDKEISILNLDKEAISKGIENARGAVVSGSANVKIENSTQPTQLTGNDLQKISAVVENIVMTIINSDDTGQLCFSYLKNGGKNAPALQNACLQFVANANEANALRIKVGLAKFEAINNKTTKTDADVQSLEEIMNEIENIGWGLQSIQQ